MCSSVIEQDANMCSSVIEHDSTYARAHRAPRCSMLRSPPASNRNSTETKTMGSLPSGTGCNGRGFRRRSGARRVCPVSRPTIEMQGARKKRIRTGGAVDLRIGQNARFCPASFLSFWRSPVLTHSRSTCECVNTRTVLQSHTRCDCETQFVTV